jgi:CHAT domain-containing protein/tetratricopeptide (TPR) repeat protein
MSGGRNNEHRNFQFQWRWDAIATVFLISVLFGCKREPQPDVVYGEIEKRFISGELAKAGEQSENAYEQFRYSRPDWAAIFRLERAKVLIYQGKSADALDLLLVPLPSGAAIQSEVRKKILLSLALAQLGHIDLAGQAVLEAERQCPEGPLRTEVSSARGSVDMSKEDIDDAQLQFRASLAGARLSNDQFLQTQALMNLGRVALFQQHYEDALMRFGEASALARPIGAKLALEKAVGNIGWIYFKAGDFQRSLDNYREAEKQAVELGGLSDQVLWLNNAGQSEAQMGDLDAARLSYEQSLHLAQTLQNQKAILDLHVDIAYLLLQLGNPNAAEEHIREAKRLAALRKNDRDELEPALLNAFLLNARGDKSGAAKFLLDFDSRAANEPSLQWDAESNLALIYSQTGRQADADRWFRRSIETFQHQRSSLGGIDLVLPFLANGNDLYVRYTKFLIDERRTDEALNVIDESRAESLEDGLHVSRPEQGGRSSQSLNAKSVAARLQATILVYSLRPKTSYLWVITPAKEQFYQIAGSETILPLVQQHTKMILASKDLLAQANAPGRSLYDALVKPAEGLIKKDSKVFIVGDDALSSLNFETLQTPGDDSHYWIEDVTITNAKSLRLLSVSKPRETRYADKHILLMGDPVYRKGEYAELPNAATEVAKIADHFSADRRTVITGPQASPEAYEHSEAGQFSYIHFVAHGTANMSSPLDSAVVLSSNQGDAAAYKLYAHDILKQNLHADLVTVSACYGSGLRNYSGEGLVGLAWAFLRAGSHQVIGAMWEVSDVSTPLLMDHLYGELAKGSQPDAALRSAKLSMIHSNGVFRKPLYWAPFQLYSGA